MRVKVGNHHGTLASQSKDGRWIIKWDKLSKSELKAVGEPPTSAIAPEQIKVIS
ncbi:MAG: hypothetical protein NVSMB70_13950 [Chamaesiphon sp.]